jgi:phosphate acetyltransferase
MPRNLYITALEERCGKSLVVLGIMELLKKQVNRVAIFRPIIANLEFDKPDHDISLIIEHFKLELDYEDSYGCTMREAFNLINIGREDDLHDLILKKYKNLEENYDFVLIEGTGVQGQETTFETELNCDIAANLGAPLILVASGRKKTVQGINQTLQLSVESHEERGVSVAAVMVNRAGPEVNKHKLIQPRHISQPFDKIPVFVIPERSELSSPSIGDVARWLDGTIIFGKERVNSLVGEYVIAAMRVENFLNYITPGCLVITPGDRNDVILASFSARSSKAYPEVSGIVLTGGLIPNDNVKKLIEGWSGAPIPIICVKGHTYLVIQQLQDLYTRIDPRDTQKIASALGTFAAHVDAQTLRDQVVASVPTRVTPKMFEYVLLERAARNRQRIVLPEGNCERILRAVDILQRRGVADLTVLGKVDEVRGLAASCGLDTTHLVIIDPLTSSLLEPFVEKYVELRKHKGMIADVARDRMSDVTYFATMMVHMGYADGMVSGALHTTAHTVRPAFEFIRTKPGVSIVSSVFLMLLRDRILVYGDCAVNPNPNARQLAEIALSSAETARTFGIEPKVAMLSYSTGSSGSGEDVDKVADATRIAKELIDERGLDIALEGPLQYDAAIDPEVARTKLSNSDVAGYATVFIFPDLNTGNNTYKAVQRAANAIAIGPILQGLNKPVNDLSRGCTVDDIVNTVAITAIQAQALKE